MRLPCPFCGLRDAAEFAYEGDASVEWPALDAPAEAWLEAVYLREQPRGRSRELWRHAFGCRSWLVIERDNVTHEVFEARMAHPGMAAAMSEVAGGAAPAGEASSVWTRPPVAGGERARPAPADAGRGHAAPLPHEPARPEAQRPEGQRPSPARSGAAQPDPARADADRRADAAPPLAARLALRGGGAGGAGAS